MIEIEPTDLNALMARLADGARAAFTPTVPAAYGLGLAAGFTFARLRRTRQPPGPP